MPDVRSLYGKKIVPHHMLNYTEQIYDILVGEIELGRWKVHERLPGVMALAKELGFGTKTVQSAYDRLKQEGYIRTLGYRGTYLKSRHPQAKPTTGKIGVLVSEDQTGQPLVLWYEHVILQVARRKNLVTEVRVRPATMDVCKVSQKGVLFDEDVQGIISLTPFRIPARYEDSGSTLPIVFLCPPFERCAPKVCADVREAYYDLTSRLIRYGHTRIVFSEDAVESDPRQTVMHREGYLEAMQEHGLCVDTKLMEASRKVVNTDLSSVIAHLTAIMKRNETERPTAIVADSLGRNMIINRVASLQKINIPEDLSVVSIGSAHIEGSQGRQLTGMLPDFDRMIDLCLTMLEEQRQSGKSDFTKIHVRMHFLPGHTLRSLVGPVGTSAGPAINHDLQTLSKTVS